MYIGNCVDSNLLQQLFGISSADAIPTQVVLSDPFGIYIVYFLHGNNSCLGETQNVWYSNSILVA